MEIEKIKDILIKAGWTEDYKVPTEDIIAVYQKYGFPVFENVLELLQKVGRLKIEFDNKKSGQADCIDFNFEKACQMEVPEKLQEEYNVRAGTILTVIGTAYRQYYIVMMDQQGSVYMAYDSILFKCGISTEEAVLNIVDNKDFEEIK